MDDQQFCFLCGDRIFNPVNKNQKYHVDCRKIIKKIQDRNYSIAKKTFPELGERSELVNKRVYDLNEYFKVVGGPQDIQDFVEVGSYFTNQDIVRGITDGWIPSGTILKKKETMYIIEGKKRLILVGGKNHAKQIDR